MIEDHGLGEVPRAELRRWYWSNVFLERYSGAVESKSRKDDAEMLALWGRDKAEPSVFAEARARIGSEGYGVRDSASHASAVYSGVFCLLALRGARDWLCGESIQLQGLHDHHIFPKAYLKRHGVVRLAEVNSVVNRTLISDKTNAKIRDKAPAAYVASAVVFPSGASPSLLSPHFLDERALDAMRSAGEGLAPAEIARLYEEFRSARESAIIAEIRAACGVRPRIRDHRP